MLKPVNADNRTEFLENTHYPLIRDAYLVSIENIVTNINLSQLEELIGKTDIEGAFRSLNIDSVSFRPYDIAFLNAFENSATAETMAMPRFEKSGREFIFRYDIRNIDSERWIKEHLNNFITSITMDQKKVISNTILSGFADDLSKRTIALNIAGRINSETGKREGGVIGLSSVQEAYVYDARKELLSDKTEDRTKYLKRTLRDKRFDSVVKNSIAQGKILTIETADKLAKSYSNRLLMFRAGLISQVETSVAINQGRVDSYIQAIRAGAINSEQVKKTWHSIRDRNVRNSHRALDRVTIPIFSKFRTPQGALLDYPKDPMAPAEERLGCRCRMYMRVNGVLR